MHSALSPKVALLTDFGSGDGDVAVMKGVIAGIVPAVLLIDITHEVAAQQVASAAWILASAYLYFPAGTVFVCVVDPGVGSSRCALALHAGDWFFVGPDNGLFSFILSEQTVHGVVELTNPAYRLPHVSATFHGRDIFAPAGAHLAGSAGEVFAHLGPARAPETLVRLPVPDVQQRGTGLEARILHIDHFGNLITSIPLSLIPEFVSAPHVQVTFPTTGTRVEQRRRFFADGAEDGQPFLYADSSGYLGIAVRNGSAARTLHIGYQAPVTFTTSSI
jgi:S-adenosylmethionine hydrolase